jgi:hypothetical protein
MEVLALPENIRFSWKGLVKHSSLLRSYVTTVREFMTLTAVVNIICVSAHNTHPHVRALALFVNLTFNRPLAEKP